MLLMNLSGNDARLLVSEVAYDAYEHGSEIYVLRIGGAKLFLNRHGLWDVSTYAEKDRQAIEAILLRKRWEKSALQVAMNELG